jgi:hypothetical protein
MLNNGEIQLLGNIPKIYPPQLIPNKNLEDIPKEEHLKPNIKIGRGTG